MKLGVRIGLSFAGVLGVTTVAALISMQFMSEVKGGMEALETHDIEETDRVLSLREAQDDLQFEVRKYVLTWNEKDWAPVEEHLKRAKEADEAYLELAEKMGGEMLQISRELSAQLDSYSGLILKTKEAVADAISAREQFSAARTALLAIHEKAVEQHETDLKDAVKQGAQETALENLSSTQLVDDVASEINKVSEGLLAAVITQDAAAFQKAAQFDSLNSKIAALLSSATSEGDRDTGQALKTAASRFQDRAGALKTKLSAYLDIGGKRATAAATIRATTEKCAEDSIKGLRQAGQEAKTIAGNTSTVQWISTFLALLAGAGIAWWITGVIVKPVRKALDLAEAIKQGDLTKRLRLETKDELGQLGAALDGMADGLENVSRLAEKIADGDLTEEVVPLSENDSMRQALRKMTESLNNLIALVNEAVEQVSSGSMQVSDASQSLSQGATEQAASLEEITSSLTEVGAQTKTNAENATQAKQLAVAAREAAQKGGDQMHEMRTAMTEIQESSRNVVKIVKVIDDIAFQTNLLALNAAVEAARAGRHGKGFAVVAEEVRNLAVRSAKAAQEANEGIEGSSQKIDNGSRVAVATVESLAGISDSVLKVNDLVGEIAAASNEQAQAIAQVNIGMTQIDGVTQQNTANAEETASAAEELSSQASELRRLLSRFTLKKQSSGSSRAAPPERPMTGSKHLAARKPPSPAPERSAMGPKESRQKNSSEITSEEDSWGQASKPAKKTGSKTGSDPIIVLDDSEFGRY